MAGVGAERRRRSTHLGVRPVYDPSAPFRVHTVDGETLDIRTGATERPAAAFRPADAALKDYVILDFGVTNGTKRTSETPGHPRHPFHRIEIVHISDPVRVEPDGELLAESSHPYQLVEAAAADAVLPAARGRDRRAPSAESFTHDCAYKGQVHYWSLDATEDIA